MKDFSYYKPSTVSEAVALLAAGGENRPLAGGMTLLPTMKMRLASPTAIVDLATLPGLTTITVGGGSVTIGAMTTHAKVAASAEIKTAIPALATLAGLIGDPQVRHRGTIGGSMANADPSADYPAAAVGLGATIVTDRREITADSFFTAMFQTALEPDEIILAVRFPDPGRGRLCQVQESGIAFCAGWRLRGALRRHRARRDYRGWPGGISIQGHRGCAGDQLLARGAGADFDCAVRIELRHPCRQRVSRPSGGGDGPPGCRAGPRT